MGFESMAGGAENLVLPDLGKGGDGEASNFRAPDSPPWEKQVPRSDYIPPWDAPSLGDGRPMPPWEKPNPQPDGGSITITLDGGTEIRMPPVSLDDLAEYKQSDKGVESSFKEGDNAESDKYRNCPREGHGGHWKGDGGEPGERGESNWYPNRGDTPKKDNPDNKTWGEIRDKYGIDYITYKDGEPDFSKVSKGKVEIEGFTGARDGKNYNKADIKLAEKWGCDPAEVKEWRKENGYTWHECRDQKTMQLVPREVHGNVSHSGGISEAKKGAQAA